METENIYSSLFFVLFKIKHETSFVVSQSIYFIHGLSCELLNFSIAGQNFNVKMQIHGFSAYTFIGLNFFLNKVYYFFEFTKHFL